MLSDIMLSIIMQSVIMQIVIMPSFVKLSVVVFNVVLLLSKNSFYSTVYYKSLPKLFSYLFTKNLVKYADVVKNHFECLNLGNFHAQFAELVPDNNIE